MTKGAKQLYSDAAPPIGEVAAEPWAETELQTVVWVVRWNEVNFKSTALVLLAETLQRTSTISWRSLVDSVISELPIEFAVKDVVARRGYFAQYYPANRNIDAKVRQSLQILRDQGVLRSLGRGRYERTSHAPVFTAKLDMALAQGYKSGAQIGRVLIETWAEYNLPCLACGNARLSRLRNNSKVADFECVSCGVRYQIKSSKRRFGRKILGAEYATTLNAVRSGLMPHHVFVRYDVNAGTVRSVWAVPSKAFSEKCIEPRPELKETARRAGWKGCFICVEALDRIWVVEDGRLCEEASAKWRAL